MLTQRDMKLARKLQDWLVAQIDRVKDNMASGLEHEPYIRAVAEIRAYREIAKEIKEIEKELNAV